MVPIRKKRELSPILRREISLELLMSEKTLMHVLRGDKKVRHASIERVRRGLAARGLEHLLPAEEGTR